MIELISDRSAFKVRSPEPRKAISVSVHHDDLRSFAQITISVSDRRKRLISDRTHGQHTNAHKSAMGFRWMSNHLLYTQRPVQISQGLLIDVSNHLLYFLHAHHREQKVRDYRSTLHTASITFSTRIATYKKQGTS
jgi:hypothetical protein